LIFANLDGFNLNISTREPDEEVRDPEGQGLVAFLQRPVHGFDSDGAVAHDNIILAGARVQCRPDLGGVGICRGQPGRFVGGYIP